MDTEDETIQNFSNISFLKGETPSMNACNSIQQSWFAHMALSFCVIYLNDFIKALRIAALVMPANLSQNTRTTPISN